MGPERRRNAMRKQHSERGPVDTCLAATETLWGFEKPSEEGLYFKMNFKE